MAASARARFFDSRRWPARARRLGRSHGITRAGLATGDVFVPHDVYRTSTGVEVTHAQHYYRGLRVFRSSRVFKKHRGKSRSTPQLYRLPQNLVLKPRFNPVEALQAAMEFLQKRGLAKRYQKSSVVRDTRLAHLVDVPSVIEVSRGLEAPARMHLEIFPRTPTHFELAWIMDLTLDGRRSFQLAVSAIGRKPKLLFLAPTSLCASFDADWVPKPRNTTAAPERFPIRPIATSDGSAGTPSAWYSGGGVAMGPNVGCVSEDLTQYEPLGTLAVDNAFVWSNLLHDTFEEFGFDSGSHSFEDDDPLEAIRNTVASLEPAFFHNWVDGQTPQLQLFESPHANGRHAGEDPSILIHEYVHGVSSRLVGGAHCQYPFATRQAQGFSEGLSDYFAITILNYLDRKRNGAAAANVTLFGDAFKPGGLRDYGIDPGSWSSHMSDIYAIGKVWCAGLLDARSDIVAMAADDDAADRFIWQACVDFLKLMAPECSTSLDLTLPHARATLVTAMRSLEQVQTQFDGAGTATAAALALRNI